MTYEISRGRKIPKIIYICKECEMEKMSCKGAKEPKGMKHKEKEKMKKKERRKETFRLFFVQSVASPKIK